MKVDIPVAPGLARGWFGWARGRHEDLREPASVALASAHMTVDVVHYLDQWMPGTAMVDEGKRWQGEVDPDELEYLVLAFFNLDLQLAVEEQRGDRSDVPKGGRDSYLLLVRALLHALETEGAGRAAFVDQLRWSWPSTNLAG